MEEKKFRRRVAMVASVGPSETCNRGNCFVECVPGDTEAKRRVASSLLQGKKQGRGKISKMNSTRMFRGQFAVWRGRHE
jgi:hypothetical protein